VLEAARRGVFEPVASWELAEEVAEVLRRPRLARRYKITEAEVSNVLFLLAPLLPSVEVEVEPRDPDDAPVIASAVVAQADAIVTGDHHLIDDAELAKWLEDRGIVVHTPARLLEALGLG
jgi:putative PIN family toxin of toxin-antitoxin system